MKKNKKYRGIIVPAITPLTADHRLDENAVERLFDSFYQHNISPFILGTTGESASLPLPVKEAYIRKAARLKRPGTILYAGVSSNCFHESVDFAKYCFDNGAGAVAATPPSYYSLSESQMKKYFIDLADAIAAPVIIYNIPATTHMSIPLKLIDELSHHPHIVATKDSERSEERLQQSLQLWKDRNDFGHFLGWAAKSADALIGGSDGLIPSTGNLVPAIYSAMLIAAEQGDHAKVYEMQQLSDAYGNLYQGGRTLGESLWALKVLMKEAGLCEEHVMPPLQPQTEEEVIKLKKGLQELNHTSNLKSV
jgi:dihydrodipicolinate synthase/N-acetylneuraminate lyase